MINFYLINGGSHWIAIQRRFPFNIGWRTDLNQILCTSKFFFLSSILFQTGTLVIENRSQIGKIIIRTKEEIINNPLGKMIFPTFLYEGQSKINLCYEYKFHSSPQYFSIGLLPTLYLKFARNYFSLLTYSADPIKNICCISFNIIQWCGVVCVFENRCGASFTGCIRISSKIYICIHIELVRQIIPGRIAVSFWSRTW